MEQLNEGENPGISQDPGMGNQSKKEDANLANEQSKPLTNSADEISAGIDKDDMDSAELKEPTEEEMDEKQNNARDAFNDDSYEVSDDESDDGKLD